MVVCAIVGCRNSRDSGYSFYEISEKRRNKLKWLEICGLPKSTYKNARICEGHFTKDQFQVVDNLGKVKLKPSACPQILVPNPGRVLDQKLYTSFKLQSTDADGNSFLVADEYQLVKCLPDHQLTAVARAPFCDISNKEKICVEEEKLLTPPPTPDNYQKLLDQVRVLEAEKHQLENDNNKLTVKVHVLEERKSQYMSNVAKLFNADQQKLLELANPSTNSRKWSPETLKRAIRIRLIARARGYEQLRLEEGWPLPALCTINRRLQLLDFAPGICENMLKLLGEKVASEVSQTAKFAILSVDEMSTKPCVEYDKGLHSYIGFVSPEIARDESERSSIATHCMAVVVRGLTVHWKQLASYVLTGNSIGCQEFGIFLENIIKALHHFGITTLAVSTDMGGANQGLWSSKGVKYSRQEVNPVVPHPFPTEISPVLLYCPDVPHLVKNTWAQLLRRDFLMPATWSEKHCIQSRIVSASHVREFLSVQGNTGVRLVDIKAAALDPTQFEKMRMQVALSFFNTKLGKSIVMMVDQGFLPKEAEATGYFILDFAHWYEVMSSRNSYSGLGNDAKSLQAIAFLRELMNDISEIVFLTSKKTVDNQWKPIQYGILMATKVVLNLWERFVSTGILEYLLTSRLFTSGCENLFSQVRGHGDMHPPPVKVRHVLRLISVAQYLRAPSKASYENDDEPYYLDFLEGKSISRSEDWTINEDEVGEVLEMPFEELSRIVKMGLYFLAGWVASRLKGSCSTCDSLLLSPVPLPELPSEFTAAVSEGGLSHPTYFVWTIVLYIEDIFKQKSSSLLHRKNVKEFLISCSKKQCKVNLGVTCHDVHHNVANQFLSLRLHILASDVSKRVGNSTLFDSASAFMRTAAQNCHITTATTDSPQCTPRIRKQKFALRRVMM